MSSCKEQIKKFLSNDRLFPKKPAGRVKFSMAVANFLHRAVVVDSIKFWEKKEDGGLVFQKLSELYASFFVNTERAAYWHQRSEEEKSFSFQ